MFEGLARFNDRFRTPIVWTLRLLVGAVFIMSGFVKMVDIWGFIFKIEEYLTVWGLTQPRSLVLVAALLISGFEFVLGFQLASGSYKRSAPMLLTLMMLVMIPLTGYLLYADPIDDCGCFGDFIVLSNGATFGKNLLLMAALVYLCIYNPQVNFGFFKPAVQWIESLFCSLYILAVGLYGFNVQPMLDFRPFPSGSELVDRQGDDDSVKFVYEKDGELQEFTADSLPGDDWEFVKVRGESGSLAPITVFAGDEDVTEDVLDKEGDHLLLVITEPRRADIAFTYAINEINSFATKHGVPMSGLISDNDSDVERWLDLSMATYPVYTADETSLKQLARGVMALVMVRDGKVAWKRTVNSISVDAVDEGIAHDNLLDSLAIDPERQLRKLTLLFVILIGGLCVFQGTVIAINYAIRSNVRRLKTKAKKSDAKNASNS